MQEIEVKAHVTDRAYLLDELAKRNIHLSNPITQDDRVFIHRDIDLQNMPPDRIILRVRRQDNTTIFTLKQHGKNELDSFEREIIVNDIQALEDIIVKLGFIEQKIIQVKKIRRKSKFNDLEISLDDVEHLGPFIELEKLTDDPDSEAIQAELFKFLLELGIKKEDQITQGYDTLMRLYNTKKD